MRVPYEWLKELVREVPDPETLAEFLTLRGLEVESIEKISPQFKGILVCQIVKFSDHPRRSDLKIVELSTGGGSLQVVCGARNLSIGVKVPVAISGSILPGNRKIEKKEILGITSEGMICSEKELGLSDDESGIFILPHETKVGTYLEDVFWVSDTVLDINCPPNRGDLLSVLGIAREVASITGGRIVLPSFELEEGEEDIGNYIRLEVHDKDACPKYVLRMIKDVKIGKTPFWMRSRLAKCGMRPINSIVDVTNYVMLEIGQPLHAFDYELLRGREIKVQISRETFDFRTLDGQYRRVEPGDLLICDGTGAIALAGIMGGENSEITERTRIVALESAFFNPAYIRRTARRLNIKSEASLRFEKGVDVEGVDYASKRAIYLMRLLSGGEILKGVVECKKEVKRKSVYVNIERLNRVLGTKMEREEIREALSSIQIKVEKEDESGFTLEIPSFRHDINEYMDIVEEVARIKGYENIPETLPVVELRSIRSSKNEILERMTREYLSASGFYEVINFSFFGEKDLSFFLLSPDDERLRALRILNPISKEFSHMRTFLSPGILRSISYNLKRGERNLRFFELSHVFIDEGSLLPRQRKSLAIALTGKERDLFWREKLMDYDFFDIKGVIEGLLKRYRVEYFFESTKEPFLIEQESCDILLNGKKIGWFGRLKEEVLKAYEIEQKVYMGELDFEILVENAVTHWKIRPISKYPYAFRDFSFYVDDGIPVGSLISKIKAVSDLITDVVVFDVFRREKRSVTFRVFFQSYEATLKDEEIDVIQDRIIKELNEIEGVALRT